MRFPFYLLLALLVLSSPGAFAQAGPASAAAQPPAAPADSGAVLVFNNWYLPRYRATATSGADTTGALLSLFRKRRAAGYLFLIPYAVGASLALPIATTDAYGQRQVTSEAISPPLGIAILAATVAGFVAHANKFNKRHLLAVAHAYYAGRPVPAKYRRLLKPQHFADAAYLREALNQQMAREKIAAQ